MPLSEETEHYLVQVLRGGEVLREVELTAPEWRYYNSLRAVDGPGVVIKVAQVSMRFGPGLFAEIETNE